MEFNEKEFKEYKALLNEGYQIYSDEEVKEIVDFLFVMAQIGYEFYIRERNKAQIVNMINTTKDDSIQNDEEKGYSLCEGKYRRAS